MKKVMDYWTFFSTLCVLFLTVSEIKGSITQTILDVTSKINGTFGEGELKAACAVKNHTLPEDPMLSAAARGDLTALRQFLANGSLVDRLDAQGLTPLYVAIAQCRWPAVDLLLAKGADVNAKEEFSLLTVATQRCDVLVAALLIQLGADTDSKGPYGYPLLHLASKHSCLGIAKLLVQSGADVHLNYGSTPLMFAAENTNRELVKYLVDKGADPTPGLIEAIKKGSIDIARMLIGYGADVNAKDTYGRALHYAANQALPSIVEALLEHGALVNSLDRMDTRETPLFWAIYGEKRSNSDRADILAVVKMLIDHNADLNVRAYQLATPLHLVATSSFNNEKTRLDIAALLIDRGANMSAKNEFGVNPMHIAALRGDNDLVQMFIDKGAKLNEKFHDKEIANSLSYASTGFKNILKTLKEYVELVNLFVKGDFEFKKIYIGYTTLDLAILNENVELVEILLKGGAELSPEKSFMTPLNLACYVDNEATVQLLIASGADLHKQDNTGWSPLHIAVWKANITLVEYFIRNNASIEVRNAFGWAPLHVAAKYTRTSAVNMLLAKGCQVDVKDSAGFTPLIWAQVGGHNDLLNLLIKKGVDLTASNRYLTYLKAISNPEYIDIVTTLIDAGADINHRDYILGWTTLHWAAATGDMEVVKLLFNKGALLSQKSNLRVTPMGLARYWGNIYAYLYLKFKGAVW